MRTNRCAYTRVRVLVYAHVRLSPVIGSDNYELVEWRAACTQDTYPASASHYFLLASYLPKAVSRISFCFFSETQSETVVFCDASHFALILKHVRACVRFYSDCCHFYSEVLPRCWRRSASLFTNGNRMRDVWNTLYTHDGFYAWYGSWTVGVSSVIINQS